LKESVDAGSAWLVTGDIVQTIEEVEKLIKQVEPKVEKVFLETARQSQSSEQDVVPEHIR